MGGGGVEDGGMSGTLVSSNATSIVREHCGLAVNTASFNSKLHLVCHHTADCIRAVSAAWWPEMVFTDELVKCSYVASPVVVTCNVLFSTS